MNHLVSSSNYCSRAIKALYRSAGKQFFQQPSTSASSMQTDSQGRRYVVLRNCNGVLAVYRIRNDDHLKRLRRWPLEVE